MIKKEYTFDASYQPQVRTKTDTSRIMLDVIIALVPAMIVAVLMFGWKALLLMAPPKKSRGIIPSMTIMPFRMSSVWN